jgi:hypothetical protein
VIDDIVICPNCGSEFQPHVATCLDCGTFTVPASHLADQPREEPEPFSLPPGSEAVLVRMAESAWATGLATHLEERGIPCGIAEDPACCGGAPKLAVLVAARDLERARELDHEYFLELVPEAADSFGRLPAEGECPACGAHVPARTVECPACGLVVGETEGVE